MKTDKMGSEATEAVRSETEKTRLADEDSMDVIDGCDYLPSPCLSQAPDSGALWNLTAIIHLVRMHISEQSGSTPSPPCTVIQGWDFILVGLGMALKDKLSRKL